MKIGFDYWQVLSHYPDEIRHLINMHRVMGDDVHIISAIGKTRVGTIAGEVNAIVPMPEHCVHEVVFSKSKESPELKLAKCQELGIEVFYDDRKDVCDLLNCHGILTFQVPRQTDTTDLRSERE